MIETTIGRIAGGDDLSIEEAEATIDLVVAGRCSTQEIALLLTGLNLKGEAASEVAGVARSLRRHMRPIRTDRQPLVDTCGTGGDGLSTFNISTAAALVTAAAGVAVAKHGNRSVTSRSGSADVLRELGVNIEADVPQVEACLDELGIGFCFAPLLHPAMKAVAEVRRALGIPTIFNLVGPLANPAGAPFQVVGVGRPERQAVLAEALNLLGSQRAVVVCGDDGLDEVTLAGTTNVIEVGTTVTSQTNSSATGDPVEAAAATMATASFAAPSSHARRHRWYPRDFGLAPAPLDALRANNPAESAALIRAVLAGESGPPRDVVVANAAAALWVAGAEPDLAAAAARAAEALDRGAARQLFERLVRRSHR